MEKAPLGGEDLFCDLGEDLLGGIVDVFWGEHAERKHDEIIANNDRIPEQTPQSIEFSRKAIGSSKIQN